MVAEQLGKERSVITTAMRLLRLPDDVLKLIEEGKLTAGHGRALLIIGDPTQQRSTAFAAYSGSWSVRQTERVIGRLSRGTGRISPTVPKPAKVIDANIRAAETKLMRAFSTNIKIHPTKKGSGGKIEIEYYSTDDLDRIFQLLMKK
jgi:ParB family chromosome partitioning protein